MVGNRDLTQTLRGLLYRVIFLVFVLRTLESTDRLCGSAKGFLLIEDEHPTEHWLPFRMRKSSEW